MGSDIVGFSLGRERDGFLWLFCSVQRGARYEQPEQKVVMVMPPPSPSPSSPPCMCVFVASAVCPLDALSESAAGLLTVYLSGFRSLVLEQQLVFTLSELRPCS